MREQAVVDRFEGDFIILKTDHGMLGIPRSYAPVMACEGMVV